MSRTIQLQFESNSEALCLTGEVVVPEGGATDSLSQVTVVKSLSKWRHTPANMVCVNRSFAEAIAGDENASTKLSRSGVQWLGMKARADVLLSHKVREGRNPQEKVTELLTKFFTALGATSVSIEPEEVEEF